MDIFFNKNCSNKFPYDLPVDKFRSEQINRIKTTDFFSGYINSAGI